MVRDSAVHDLLLLQGCGHAAARPGRSRAGGGGAAREHVLVMTHLGQAGALVGRRHAAPARGQRHEQGDRNRPHPFTAAKPPMTAITTPSAIFAAAPAARPSTAPQPARTATPGVRDTEYSNKAAPTNAPVKAPITLPTIGTGTPTMAPAIPPTSAPQPERREPPYRSVSPNPTHHSRSSPRNARPSTIATVAPPIVRNH